MPLLTWSPNTHLHKFIEACTVGSGCAALLRGSTPFNDPAAPRGWWWGGCWGQGLHTGQHHSGYRHISCQPTSPLSHRATWLLNKRKQIRAWKKPPKCKVHFILSCFLNAGCSCGFVCVSSPWVPPQLPDTCAEPQNPHRWSSSTSCSLSYSCEVRKVEHVMNIDRELKRNSCSCQFLCQGLNISVSKLTHAKHSAQSKWHASPDVIYCVTV